MQNRYNLVDRTSEDVLDYCTKHGIGFIPWYPLAAGVIGEASDLFWIRLQSNTAYRQVKLHLHGS